MEKKVILAIDFGTSNSLVAGASSAEVFSAIPIDNSASDPTIMRSVLFTPEVQSWYFGNTAIDEYQRYFAEGRLFRSIKKYLPDPSFKGTQVHNNFISLTDLIGIFLKQLRATANSHFSQDIKSVVLGRPALFSDDAEEDRFAQKRLEAAAHYAGFERVEFLAEPVAAAFEFRHQLSEPKNVLIADFGGGTSDFTVLRMGRDDFQKEDVLAIGGISRAGDAFDGTIMRSMIAPYFGSNVVYRMPMGKNDLRLPNNLLNRMCSPADMSMLAKRDILDLLRDVQRWNISPEDGARMKKLFVLIEEHLGYALFRSIEKSKIELSACPSSHFSFEYPDIDIHEEIFSEQFFEASKDLVAQIVFSMDETVKRSGMTYSEIDVVCCTGGTARIPALRSALEQRLGAEKLRQHQHFHSVVGGLAERAHQLAKIS